MRTHPLALVAPLLLSSIVQAQRVEPVREIELVATQKVEYYNDPVVVGGIGYMRSPAKSKQQDCVVHRIPLDGGRAEEILVRQGAAPEEVIRSWPVIVPSGAYLLIQSWEKKTGRVTIQMQHLESTGLQPEGPLLDVGVVPLDPKSYGGDALNIRFIESNDRSKHLVYFDGIQFGGIKLAMCWVLDEHDEPVWHGGYRIPVQALGASTEVTFTNAGQVIIEVEAIVLDDSNTKEKKDGSLEAKVDKTYYGETSQTFYLLQGDEFRAWDGKLPGGGEMTKAFIADAPEGLLFLASTRKGERKSASHEWAVGRMDGSFQPVVTASGKLDQPFKRIVHDAANGFHGICWKSEDIRVMRIGADGTVEWSHEAPFSKEPNFDKFRIVAGRLVYYDRWAEGSIKKLTAGEAANLDLNAYITVPTVVSWKDGKRIVTTLYSLEARYKEIPLKTYEESLCEKGILVRGYHQKEPSMTLVPIQWD